MKMLITYYVHEMPDGTEKGDFLVVDFEGRDLRVLCTVLINELASDA